MRWVLQLVETGTDSRTRGVDVLEISRPNDFGDIRDLGLTLSEAKQLLARVQQAVVAAQAHEHAVLRPDCSSCGGKCHVGGATVTVKVAHIRLCHSRMLFVRAYPLETQEMVFDPSAGFPPAA